MTVALRLALTGSSPQLLQANIHASCPSFNDAHLTHCTGSVRGMTYPFSTPRRVHVRYAGWKHVALHLLVCCIYWPSSSLNQITMHILAGVFCNSFAVNTFSIYTPDLPPLCIPLPSHWQGVLGGTASHRRRNRLLQSQLRGSTSSRPRSLYQYCRMRMEAFVVHVDTASLPSRPWVCHRIVASTQPGEMRKGVLHLRSTCHLLKSSPFQKCEQMDCRWLHYTRAGRLLAVTRICTIHPAFCRAIFSVASTPLQVTTSAQYFDLLCITHSFVPASAAYTQNFIEAR